MTASKGSFLKRRRLLLWGIAYAVFIVIFVFSTEIALSVGAKNINHVEKISASDYAHSSSELKHGKIYFVTNQDLFYTVEFSGWVIIPSEDGNAGKQVKLFFVSDDARYAADTVLQDRFDLKTTLRENNILDYKHGFFTRFSPVQMKNGVYRLYLYCYETEQASGIVDTGRLYIKTDRDFSEYGE